MLLKSLLIPVIGFAAQVEGCHPAQWDRILECSRGQAPFALMLPDGFSSSRRQAAVIVLHGDGRYYCTLIDHAETRAALLSARTVVILPDGGRSWWREEHPVLDLLDWLTPRIPLDSKRIACSGWSMGAYGSLRLVTRYPDRFAAWGAMIGLVDYPNGRYPADANYPVPPLFGDPRSWPEADPINDAGALRGKWLWFATADAAFDAAMNRALDRVLSAKRIPHAFETIEGAHDFKIVSKLLPKMLEFFDRVLR